MALTIEIVANRKLAPACSERWIVAGGLVWARPGGQRKR
jgi:hypothetical protein